MNEKTFKKLKDNVPGNLAGVNVQNGDLNRALRIWKRNLKNSGIITELYDRKEFKKSSEKKREQFLTAQFKQSKAQ